MISWDELWMGLPYVLAITSRVSIPVSLPSLPISRQNKPKAMLWTHRLAWRTEIFSSCLCVTELELHFYCLVCTVWGQAGRLSVRVTHLAEQVIHWRAELFRQIPCTSQAFVSHTLMQLICYSSQCTHESFPAFSPTAGFQNFDIRGKYQNRVLQVSSLFSHCWAPDFWS